MTSYLNRGVCERLQWISVQEQQITLVNIFFTCKNKIRITLKNGYPVIDAILMMQANSLFDLYVSMYVNV